MPTAIGNISTPMISQLQAARNTSDADAPSGRQLKTREAFQDFVAGTFYKQMLKSLRQTLGKPAYLHGGQAEESFQAQLDQQVAEDLASSRGGAFADDLFDAFMRRQA